MVFLAPLAIVRILVSIIGLLVAFLVIQVGTAHMHSFQDGNRRPSKYRLTRQYSGLAIARCGPLRADHAAGAAPHETAAKAPGGGVPRHTQSAGARAPVAVFRRRRHCGGGPCAKLMGQVTPPSSSALLQQLERLIDTPA